MGQRPVAAAEYHPNGGRKRGHKSDEEELHVHVNEQLVEAGMSDSQHTPLASYNYTSPMAGLPMTE